MRGTRRLATVAPATRTDSTAGVTGTDSWRKPRSTASATDLGSGPGGIAGGEPWRPRLRPDRPFRAHVLTLVVGLGVLLVASRGHWFVVDEWEFLTDRRLGDVGGLFVPHNEHWSTLPIVLWRGLFAAVGLHSYWPYQLVTLAVHLGVAHLLWRVQLRARVAPGIATATSGLFVVFGAGAENILNGFAVTFDAAVLFGLGQVLLVDHEGRFDRRDVWGFVLALLGLLTSGVAVTMLAVAGLTAYLRRGLRAGLLTLAPPTAVFLVWLSVVGRMGLGRVREWEPGRIPAFVWHGLTITFDVATSTTGLGVVALAGLGWWLLRHRSELRGRLAATTACALGAVIFFGMIGVGRAMLSLAHAGTSRYLYVAGGLLLPAVGGALSDLTANRRLARVGALVLVVLLAVNGGRLLFARAEFERGFEQPYRQLLLAAARQDPPPSEAAPGPELLAAYLAYDELHEMSQQGKLPVGEDVTREWELAAQTVLKVSTSRSVLLPLGPQAGGPTAIAGGHRSDRGDAGCERFESSEEPSEVVLHVPAPVALPLRTSAGSVGVFLRDADGVRSPINYLVRLEHAPNYLNLDLHGQEVVLTLPPGTFFQLCGLGGSGRGAESVLAGP